jgi:hypothetical protein
MTPVAFYDMHGLQWDYSLIPATTRDLSSFHQIYFWDSKRLFFSRLLRIWRMIGIGEGKQRDRKKERKRNE